MARKRYVVEFFLCEYPFIVARLERTRYLQHCKFRKLCGCLIGKVYSEEQNYIALSKFFILHNNKKCSFDVFNLSNFIYRRCINRVVLFLNRTPDM